jgi:phasin family protein
MASKSLKASSARPSTPTGKPATAAPDSALAFSQDQMQALIALADVVFKGIEEIRRCQMQAAHDAREHHGKKQAEVAHASTPTEVFNVQSELLRFDLEAAGKYWQQLAAICAATQADAMNLITRSAATMGGDVTKLLGQPMAMPQMPGFQVPAFQLPAEGASATAEPAQAWNQWVDLGKQWTDMLYRTEAALH